tara:strand:- start:5588 stop:6568 length:981 start_codon:yes stop_codon:yes gene_type:complete
MILKVENLNISFETSKGILGAIRNLSFELELGETLGVVGESGCGKSITNLALMGLLPDTAIVKADKIDFEGKDLTMMNEKKWQDIRGSEIAMIFQDPMSALNPSFTVGFQIDETLKVHFPNMNKQQRYARSIELLNQVGIPAPEERIKSYAHELSGGMSQRVMIAMAIACDPKLLIADEPTTALDVTIQDQILKLLKDIQKEKNMAMILVTHDLGVVAQNSDRIQVMYAGEVIETGTAKQVIHEPQHPYTQGLIASLPGKSKTSFRQPLPSIEGMVPDLTRRPSGCQFHPRCKYSQEDCINNHPLIEKVKNHNVRCHFPLSEQVNS